MNKLLTVAAASFVLWTSGCTNDLKNRQKSVLSDVLKSHDKVMTDEESIQLKDSQLDSLLKQKPGLKAQIDPLKASLSSADDAMMNWMHQFKEEYTRQPSEEAIRYLTSQKEKLTEVDAKLIAAATRAGQFINQHK